MKYKVERRGATATSRYSFHESEASFFISSVISISIISALTMRLATVCFHFFCVLFHLTAAVHLKAGAGKEAEMDDVLKVAKQAHRAAEIYAKEKHNNSPEQAAKNVYLVCMMRAADAPFWNAP